MTLTKREMMRQKNMSESHYCTVRYEFLSAAELPSKSNVSFISFLRGEDSTHNNNVERRN